jgi:hypothetical protein
MPTQKATKRLTKNGKRRGRPPKYLTQGQTEFPLGVRAAARNRGGHDPRVSGRRDNLRIIRRELAKRGAKHKTKKESASLVVAIYQPSSQTARDVEAVARMHRRLNAKGVNRL